METTDVEKNNNKFKKFPLTKYFYKKGKDSRWD